MSEGQPQEATDLQAARQEEMSHYLTSAGSGVVDVPGDIRRIDEVLVTPERLGGSLRPTHAPVIVAQIG